MLPRLLVTTVAVLNQYSVLSEYAFIMVAQHVDKKAKWYLDGYERKRVVTPGREVEEMIEFKRNGKRAAPNFMLIPSHPICLPPTKPLPPILPQSHGR